MTIDASAIDTSGASAHVFANQAAPGIQQSQHRAALVRMAYKAWLTA